MKDKGGRPTKYKEEYCQMLIDHMKEGFTFESFAAVINVNRDTLYAWANDFPLFSDAKSQGRDQQLFCDEKTLKDLVKGKLTGSASAHIFKMKNCHRWVDRTEVESTNTNKNVELSYEEYLKSLSNE